MQVLYIVASFWVKISIPHKMSSPHLSYLLKVTVWVGAAGGLADGNVTVAGTLLARLWSP